MHIDPVDAFEGSDEKGVLIEQLTRFTAFYMPFLELRVLLFDEGNQLSLSSIGCSVWRFSIAIQRSYRLPSPSRSRIFWMVTKLT